MEIDDYQLLLEVSTPELYRDNPFRILGLPITASLREIERHQERLTMAMKLGIPADSTSQGCLPLPANPDQEVMRRATERLRNHRTRFIDEFFWFWPTEAGSFPGKALDLLSKNRVHETIELWLKITETDSCSITAHNLAVLYHLNALDIEYKSATERLLDEELKACSLCWKGAYREWKRLLDNEAFWAKATARVQQSGNPFLSTDVVRLIRRSLPRAIFQINASIAKLAAHRKDDATCNYHIKLVKAFGFDGELFKAVLHESVASTCQRIRIICSHLESTTEANTEHLNTSVWEFLLEAESLLHSVDLLLPHDDLVREGVHDQIAEAARNSTILYVNNTDDWEEGAKLLLRAFDFATDPSLRNRLQEDIRIVNNNAESDRTLRAHIIAETEKKESISSAAATIDMKCSLARKSAEENAGEADRAIWQLLLETRPLLKTLEELASDDESVLNREKDRICETVLLCQIDYGNRTKNWRQSVVLLMSIRELAASDSLRGRIKESIARLHKSLQQEQEHEDLKHVKAENHVFEVRVSGQDAIIPSVCSCCLAKAETTYDITNYWMDGEKSRTRTFSIPLCKRCKHHQREWRYKRAYFISLVTVLPIIVSYLIGFNSDTFGYFQFMVLSSIIFVFIFLILSSLIPLEKLSEKHASRGTAVTLKDVGLNYSIFRFLNPSYAHVFADANNSRVQSKEVLKFSRNLHLIRGAGFFKRIIPVTLFVLVACSVEYAFLNSSHWGDLSLDNRSASKVYSSRTNSNNRQVINNYSQPSLSEINEEKAKLKEMESELQALDLQADSLSAKINALKLKIAGWESDAASGSYVDRQSYSEAISSHNELVRQYNALILSLKMKYTAYEQKYKTLNRMIDEYNKRSY